MITRPSAVAGHPALAVLTSMATRRLLDDLAAVYRRRGVPVRVTARGGVDAVRSIRQGAVYDVAVLSDDALRELMADDFIMAGSATPLVDSPLAAAVRDDAPPYDLATEAGLRQALLGCTVIGLSTGPSGRHLRQCFAQWGLSDAELRIVEAPPGVPVGSLVADGSVALGFQQHSEFLAIPGLRILRALPPAIQTITTFSTGLLRTCQNPAAARDWLAFLVSPEAAAFHARHGLEPAQARA
ncbi:MAG: substrate-binding domain-containing protein [Pigmentiphaga sp.]|nr:substrate-binding domain-containing protein [Pigmentiphaga sp.]